MICLGIDTSSFAIGLGIVRDEETIYNIYCNRGSPSADKIHTMILGALKDVDLTFEDIGVFACTIGPGSFTGIRVGIATIKGLSFSLNRPVYGIPTFDAFVWRFLNHFEQIVPMLDAKRNNVYAAVYKKGKQIVPTGKMRIDCLFEKIEGDVLFLGDGVKLYRNLILKRFKNRANLLTPNINSPRGEDVAYQGLLSYREGKASDETIEPIYIDPLKIRKKSRPSGNQTF